MSQTYLVADGVKVPVGGTIWNRNTLEPYVLHDREACPYLSYDYFSTRRAAIESRLTELDSDIRGCELQLGAIQRIIEQRNQIRDSLIAELEKDGGS